MALKNGSFGLEAFTGLIGTPYGGDPCDPFGSHWGIEAVGVLGVSCKGALLCLLHYTKDFPLTLSRAHLKPRPK